VNDNKINHFELMDIVKIVTSSTSSLDNFFKINSDGFMPLKYGKYRRMLD
jgi:hypothetical protein